MNHGCSSKSCERRIENRVKPAVCNPGGRPVSSSFGPSPHPPLLPSSSVLFPRTSCIDPSESERSPPFPIHYWARHARPLNKVRFWRTPDLPEVRHKCVTDMPAEPSAGASPGAPTLASPDASPGPLSNDPTVKPVAPSGGASTRPPRVRRWRVLVPAKESSSGGLAAPSLRPGERGGSWWI
jgi:hypothetical protein